MSPFFHFQFNVEDYGLSPISVGQSDRIGYYSPDNEMPIGTNFYNPQDPPVQERGVSSRFLPSASAIDNIDDIDVGDRLRFLDFTYPYVLQLNVCNVTGTV